MNAGARLDVYVDGGRYHVSWTCRDSGLWHDILYDFKLTFSRHWERVYCPRSRTWSVPSACLERLEDWANDWFDPDAQSWDDEPEPAPRGGPPATALSELEEALRTLHLLPTAPDELVRAAHKVMVRLVHPDKEGGSHEQAVEVNKAWEVIERARRKMGRSA